jgi:hypothetical protein
VSYDYTLQLKIPLLAHKGFTNQIKPKRNKKKRHWYILYKKDIEKKLKSHLCHAPPAHCLAEPLPRLCSHLAWPTSRVPPLRLTHRAPTLLAPHQLAPPRLYSQPALARCLCAPCLAHCSHAPQLAHCSRTPACSHRCHRLLVRVHVVCFLFCSGFLFCSSGLQGKGRWITSVISSTRFNFFYFLKPEKSDSV